MNNDNISYCNNNTVQTLTLTLKIAVQSLHACLVFCVNSYNVENRNFRKIENSTAVRGTLSLSYSIPLRTYII